MRFDDEFGERAGSLHNSEEGDTETRPGLTATRNKELWTRTIDRNLTPSPNEQWAVPVGTAGIAVVNVSVFTSVIHHAGRSSRHSLGLTENSPKQSTLERALRRLL